MSKLSLQVEATRTTFASILTLVKGIPNPRSSLQECGFMGRLTEKGVDIDMVAPAGGKPAAYTHRDGAPYENIRRRGP